MSPPTSRALAACAQAPSQTHNPPVSDETSPTSLKRINGAAVAELPQGKQFGSKPPSYPSAWPSAGISWTIASRTRFG
jgi:hypothetical protein